MAQVRPELVFVVGPQQGQRAVIMSDVAVVGRSRTVEVCVAEEYVSREHLRFAFTADGWMVENLSPRGMRVNGRKYKAGKRLILETGDVLAIGAETQILFVAPGDDPDAAVRQYRQTCPSPVTAPLPSQKPKPSAAPAEPPVSAEATPQAASREKAQSDQAAAQAEPAAPTAELEALAKKAKYKKYALFLGIYFLAFLAFVFVAVGGKKKQEIARTQPVKLSESALWDAIRAELAPSFLPTAATTALDDARALYDGADVANGRLYLTVSKFKMYLAWKGSPGFDYVEDEQKYDMACKRLLEAVKREYDNGYHYAREAYWQKAKQSYERILNHLVPERSDVDPTYKKLIVNVLEHLDYVRRMSKQ